MITAYDDGNIMIAKLGRMWHDRNVDAGNLRASDADRERVAERLRTALDEGRLNLHEYDDRLREAFNAKTYNELNALLADLPAVTPEARSQVTPYTSQAPRTVDGRYTGATRAWLWERWTSWFSAVAICTGIWGISALAADKPVYFWPIWVAGPWGIVLLVGTITGLSNNEPQRWAARRERRRAEREVRREARRQLEHED